MDTSDLSDEADDAITAAANRPGVASASVDGRSVSYEKTTDRINAALLLDDLGATARRSPGSRQFPWGFPMRAFLADIMVRVAGRLSGRNYQAATPSVLYPQQANSFKAYDPWRVAYSDGARLGNVGRYLVRNTVTGARACEWLGDRIVGPGFFPDFDSGDEARDEDLETLFKSAAHIRH